MQLICHILTYIFQISHHVWVWHILRDVHFYVPVHKKISQIERMIECKISPSNAWPPKRSDSNPNHLNPWTQSGQSFPGEISLIPAMTGHEIGTNLILIISGNSWTTCMWRFASHLRDSNQTLSVPFSNNFFLRKSTRLFQPNLIKLDDIIITF